MLKDLSITIRDVEFDSTENYVSVYENVAVADDFKWWVCYRDGGCSERTCVAKFKKEAHADSYALVVNRWIDKIDLEYGDRK